MAMASGNRTNTVDNPGDRKILGNSLPTLSYGLNAGFDWKGFDATVIFKERATLLVSKRSQYELLGRLLLLTGFLPKISLVNYGQKRILTRTSQEPVPTVLPGATWPG